jgi:hypothetical protein
MVSSPPRGAASTSCNSLAIGFATTGGPRGKDKLGHFVGKTLRAEEAGQCREEDEKRK